MVTNAHEQLKELFMHSLDRFFFQRGEIVQTKIEYSKIFFIILTDNKGYM